METLIYLLLIALVIENYGNLYKFLTGKSQKAPYYFKKDEWDWQNFDQDDIY